jgi:hypothetical protein
VNKCERQRSSAVKKQPAVGYGGIANQRHTHTHRHGRVSNGNKKMHFGVGTTSCVFLSLSFVWSCKRLDSDCRIAFWEYVYTSNDVLVWHAIITVLCYTRGVCAVCACGLPWNINSAVVAMVTGGVGIFYMSSRLGPLVSIKWYLKIKETWVV